MGADRGSEYNCEIVNAIAEAYGDQPYLRRDGEAQTLAELLAEAASGCSALPAILYTASPIEGARLYDCADTVCDAVEQLTAAAILDVTATDDDWLTVLRGGQTLYLPAGAVDKLSLEMRIKDMTPTFQVHAGCFITPSLGPGSDMAVEFIIAGTRREQVTVDLHAPGADGATPVASQEEEPDPNTALTVIARRYTSDPSLATGKYIVALTAKGHLHPIAWDVTRAGAYRVTLGCE